jgi:hypothetical protein
MEDYRKNHTFQLNLLAIIKTPLRTNGWCTGRSGESRGGALGLGAESAARFLLGSEPQKEPTDRCRQRTVASGLFR